MKKFLSLFALIVITVMLISVIACSSQTTVPDKPAGNKPTSQIQPAGPPDRVDIVYFHETNPCYCMRIVGDYIQQVVWVHFLEQEDEGKLTLNMVASDNPSNAALVKKFKSPPFWLYIVEVHGETETIHSVPEIWGLTGDTEKLAAFIKEKIQNALDGTL